MRVEPNKKMVYLHISAYKSIIADLRDEIEKLKTELSIKSSSDTILKHPDDIKKIERSLEIEEEKKPVHSQSVPKIQPGECLCEQRLKDDNEKLIVCTEIA